jgi:hypothetical protein
MPVVFRSAGTLLRPEPWVRPDGRARWIACPNWCAIVQRPDGIVLVDAGWSRAACAFPSDELGPRERWLGLRLRAEDALASQLISLGLDPNDVRHIIATGSDEGCIAGAVDFPRAALDVVGLDATRRESLPIEVVEHRIDGPPALGFPRSHDLLGDGTVLLLAAGVARRDRIAVGIRLDDGWLVHGGRAAPSRAWLDAGERPARRWFDSLFVDRARTLAALTDAARNPSTRLVLTNDPALTDALPTTMEKAWATSCDRSRKQTRAPRPAKSPEPAAQR